MSYKFYIILAVYALAFTSAIAQSTGKRERKNNIKLADWYFENRVYPKALPVYLSLHEEDSSNADLNHKIAICYLYAKNDHEEAISYFEKAIRAGNADVYFDLGLAYHLDSRFDDAIKAFQIYRNSLTVKEYYNSDVNRFIEISKRAKQMIANPLDVKIENLGKNINSSYADYVPIITVDESVLIFTSRNEESTGQLLDQNNEYFEDIYISYKKNGTWSKAVKIDTNINTKGHDACIGLSADGQQLFIYKTDEENTVTGDIYISRLKGTSWSVPEKLGLNVNTSWHETSANMTADRKVLYFSSDRPGGYGGRDIYRSDQDPIYEWGPAQNLGPTINTRYDEDDPFIHADGKTLYFSSQGHNTMGGFDIFKSVLDEDGMWSEPENLGYLINHVDDDRFFVLSASGERAYYSSDRKGGFGGHDIYLIHMSTKTVDMIVMKGIIRSLETKEPLGATIMIIDNETRKTEGIYKSNSATGQYMLVIPPERVFEITILAKGYKPHHSNFVLDKVDSYKEIVKDYELKPWKKVVPDEQ